MLASQNRQDPLGFCRYAIVPALEHPKRPTFSHHLQRLQSVFGHLSEFSRNSEDPGMKASRRDRYRVRSSPIIPHIKGEQR